MTSYSDKRRIVVTGAASGIGADLVRRLNLQQFEVIPLDRLPVDGGITCDLASAAGVRAALDSIGGRIDGIAHVAGLPGTADSAAIAAVNIIAVRHLTLGLLDQLNEGASIVAVSSITAYRCGWPDNQVSDLLALPDAELSSAISQLTGADAYAASKRLLNHWVSTWSARLLERRIRVNAVSPGPVDTPLLKDFEESMGAERIRAASDLVGRHGSAREIAATIDFLLSPSSSWVNGVNIECDGGFSNARRARARAELSPTPLDHFPAG